MKTNSRSGYTKDVHFDMGGILWKWIERSFLRYFLIMMALVVFVPRNAQASTNLGPELGCNGSFENLLSNYGYFGTPPIGSQGFYTLGGCVPYVQYWEDHYGDGGDEDSNQWVITGSSSLAQEGSNFMALRYHPPLYGSGFYWVNWKNNLPHNPAGREYQLQFYMSNGPLVVEISRGDHGEGFIVSENFTSASSPTSPSWELKTLVFSVPPSSTYYFPNQINVRIRRPSGEFTYVDNFSLKECLPGPPPPPPSPIMGIGNLVWCDDNNNGIRDVGEAGIDGVTVQLVKDQNGDGTISSTEETTIVATTTTSGGGFYQFTGLYPGRYRVLIPTSNFATGQALAQKTRSSSYTGLLDNGIDNDDNGAQANWGAITKSPVILLEIGTEPPVGVDGTDTNTDSTIDFGFTSTTCLGGTVWCDDNNDGIMNFGESMVPGVTVLLYQDLNCDGDINDAGEGVVVAYATTASNGTYFFENLLPGCYMVVIPDYNFVSSGGGIGGGGGVIIGGGGKGDDSGGIVAIGGGIVRDGEGLGGGGGVRDGDGGGKEELGGGALTGKPYSSAVTPTSGWGSGGSKNAQTPGVDVGYQSEGGATTNSATITLLAGDCPTNIHFGFTDSKATLIPDPAPNKVGLGDYVWCDENNNGLRDPFELGIVKVLLELYFDANNNGVIDGTEANTPVATTYSDDNGFYLFTDLDPGKYQVRIPVSNFITGSLIYKQLSSTTTSTNDDQIDNDDNGIQVGGPGTLVVSPVIDLSLPVVDPKTGQTIGGEPGVAVDCTGDRIDSTIDFGFVPTGGIGNLVWCDDNNNGIRDAGEAGISGVTVHLLRDANWDGDFDDAGEDTPIATTTTDSNGNYQFSGLLNGNYKVCIPATNFKPGSALQDKVRSSEPTSFFDDQKDNDDNGIQLLGNGNEVCSPLIVLTSGSEPPASVDGTDETIDSTVDFGFYAPLGIGNLVWCDDNKDGIAQSTEPGFQDVLIWLMEDKNKDGDITDPDEALPVQFTRTDVSGLYQFINLGKGHYVVRVLAGNAGPGGPLELKPIPTFPRVTADNQTDNDNNGSPVAGGHFDSGIIVLQAGQEPLVGVDGTDANTDSTIDFGFIDQSCPEITLNPTTLPNGTVGVAYSQVISASGGSPSYFWTSTNLPAGLTLNTSTGNLTGTPTAAGVATITVTDKDGCSSSLNFTVSAAVCEVTGLTIDAGPCNSNGTPLDLTDDYYTAAVTVSYANPPSTGNLVLSGPALHPSNTVSTVPVGSLGSPTSHTFTGVRLKANGTALNLTATFQ